MKHPIGYSWGFFHTNWLLKLLIYFLLNKKAIIFASYRLIGQNYFGIKLIYVVFYWKILLRSGLLYSSYCISKVQKSASCSFTVITLPVCSCMVKSFSRKKNPWRKIEPAIMTTISKPAAADILEHFYLSCSVSGGVSSTPFP